jgi:urease accessory protein
MTPADALAAVAVARLPDAFARYQQEPEQLPPGVPGKVGLLDLRFEARAGRTVLVWDYSTGLQQVGRALYLDRALPGMAFALVQSVGGGVVQGDRLGLDLAVGQGAQAHFTTQSATKIYEMERNYATQVVRVRVEGGAYLEFLPDPLILYRNARFYQEVELEVADDATLLFSDSVTPGRVAYGEMFDYDLLVTRIQARDPAGRLRFTDTMVLEPARRDPRRTAILGGRTNLGSLYVLTRQACPDELAERLHRSVQHIPGIDAGASQLPGSDGALVRVIGDGSGRVGAALHCAWQVTRELILGVSVPGIHKLKHGTEPKIP